MLFTSTRYPSDYGFIEDTLAADGDPLGALVLLDEPTFPGCLITCRVIGMFRMRDEKGLDDKVLCAPATDPRIAHLQDISDVPPFDRLEIRGSRSGAARFGSMAHRTVRFGSMAHGCGSPASGSCRWQEPEGYRKRRGCGNYVVGCAWLRQSCRWAGR